MNETNVIQEEQILIRVTGQDRPGLTAEIMCILACLLYTSPSPRDVEESRMPSSA